MDLTVRDSMKLKYRADEESGTVTIEIYTADGLTRLGEITAERQRLRPLLQALHQISHTYGPPSDTTIQGYKLDLDFQTGEGAMRFR